MLCERLENLRKTPARGFFVFKENHARGIVKECSLHTAAGGGTHIGFSLELAPAGRSMQRTVSHAY